MLEADQPIDNWNHVEASVHMLLEQGMHMQRVLSSKIGNYFAFQRATSAAWHRI